MYVVLAPIRLNDGVTERTLIEASETFQTDFVSQQAGIVRRILLRGRDGTYADLVFFEDKAAADRVVAAEAASPHCARFFSIMQAPDESLPDMGVLGFEQLAVYE